MWKHLRNSSCLLLKTVVDQLIPPAGARLNSSGDQWPASRGWSPAPCRYDWSIDVWWPSRSLCVMSGIFLASFSQHWQESQAAVKKVLRLQRPLLFWKPLQQLSKLMMKEHMIFVIIRNNNNKLYLYGTFLNKVTNCFTKENITRQTDK